MERIEVKYFSDAIDRLAYVDVQAEVAQMPSRHLEMPDELKDNDGTDVQYE